MIEWRILYVAWRFTSYQKINNIIEYPFSMKILFVGDACSGKTTILRRLKEGGYPVILEEGWQTIPPEIEADKFQSFIWFTNYYFEREKNLAHEEKYKAIFIERPFHTHYPYAKAQFFSGKITEEQYKQEIAFLDSLATQIPLNKETVVLHFVSDSETMRARLEARGRKQTKEQEKYWDFMRQFTEEYFTKYKYYKIDTTTLSLDETYREVKRILDPTLSS